MRILSYLHQGRPSYGLRVDGGIVDLSRRLGPALNSARALIEQNAWARVAPLQHSAPDFGLDAVQLLPALPDPGTIVCIGLNYEEHRLETGRPKAEHPAIFLRIAESLQAHDAPLVIPRESEQFDFEGELAVVIGRRGRRITAEQALSHVCAYACFNDATVRDWQNHTHQFTPGKNFPGTGAFGPDLVTPDELPADGIVTLETRVNGQVMQHASTAQLIFSIPRLIAYVSTFMTLQAGDVIVTGTPGGVGAKRKPPLWLRDGDVVEVEISHVGLLRNRCVKED